MAKKQRKRSAAAAKPKSSVTDTRVFLKGMVKDANASFQAKQAWSHARNAANNSTDGDTGVIGNEPANIVCANVPYTIIGAIHTYADQWVIYSTDDNNSEIGLFDDSKCTYTTIVNDQCLNFNKKHLIVGASKENFDCTWQVYWDDGNNPSRTLNIDNVPYVQIQTSPTGADCKVFQDTNQLDCEKLRLAPLVDTPCLTLSKSEGGGQLRNGTYQAFIAYTVNEQRVTDYIGISNIQSLFDHGGIAGSLRVTVSNLDQDFEFYELVILSNNQQATVAKRIGLYSTEQTDIEIDYIDQALINIPLEDIPLRSPAYEKSEGMFVVNDYLIRKSPTEQFDFNYQPLANKIKAKWVVAEYPADYYYKGGNSMGFMRDEQYSFFIRWIYNTGERSSSYHIPGRAPTTIGINQFGEFPVNETALAINPNSVPSLNQDNVFVIGKEKNFQVYNTAQRTQFGLNIPVKDGGTIISKGIMGYWESTERYPSRQPDIWGDLCGKYIRHHKMPTEELHEDLHLSNADGTKIRVLGVEFHDIQAPVDNDGNLIPNIVGYELLRGSREGHRSILAKGIFRNMREYNIPEEGRTLGDTKGLYPNYPYNDLRDDIYFHDGSKGYRTDGCDTTDNTANAYPALSGYRQDYFTFHSPELMFRRPFLNAYETRIYGDVSGESLGYFIKSEGHPKNKLIRNAGAWIAAIIGIGYAIGRTKGDQTYSLESLSTGFTAVDSVGATTTAAATAAAFAGPPLALTNNLLLGGLIDALTDVAALWAGPSPNRAAMQGIHQTQMLEAAIPGLDSGKYINTYTIRHPSGQLPLALIPIYSIISVFNIADGAQEIVDLMYNLVSATDFAYKHNSHGFYNEFTRRPSTSIFRTRNLESNYIGSSFQKFGDYKVNNLFRPTTVGISTSTDLADPAVQDKSRYIVNGDIDSGQGHKYLKTPETERVTPISALYGALKFNFENQYGQLDGIKQVQMRGCIELTTPSTPNDTFVSNPVFAGDTFINRYTEKTVMPIFTDFLNGQPDQFPYDYLQRVNIPYPRFWMDTRKFSTTNLAKQVMAFGQLKNVENYLPTDLFYLDVGDQCYATTFKAIFDSFNVTSDGINDPFSMKYGYMYTHVNGIQDFFVESEYNLAQRDWEDTDNKRHYDIYEYTNVDDLFHADIIKDGNFYKYDLSLSPSRFATQLTSFGNIQPRDYDPTVAENCFQEYPKRLIYSLRAQEEAKKDFWRVFLPNNYKDFRNEVTTIKPVNEAGALVFFPYQSPALLKGTEELTTDLGTKISVGDGSLFAQKNIKNIVNSDMSHEYGSVESARGVINTPSGIFFISQAQGKVFQFAGKLLNIANAGMKWWFNKYLPSTLIRQFPELEHSKLGDNPVIGVGCQVVYDANDDIVYFSKKDFEVKPEYKGKVLFYNDKFTYFLSDNVPAFDVKIGDPAYFNNTSWTVSYDPKAKAWISFHDWHPELTLPSINHFFTTKTEIVTEPACPPGFSFNQITQKCETTGQDTSPATVTVEEVAPTVLGGPQNCLLDIVIAMDVSGSTAYPATITGQGEFGSNYSFGVFNAQVKFVQEFLQQLSPKMQAGEAQVGFVNWATGSVTYYHGSSNHGMSNTVTFADLNTFYDAETIFYGGDYANNGPTMKDHICGGGGTDISIGYANSETLLNNKTNSALGDRSSDPNLRSILIFMTDATNVNKGGIPNDVNNDNTGLQIGCEFLTNNPNSEVYAVYSSPSDDTFPSGTYSNSGTNSPIQLDLPNDLTCNNAATNAFVVRADGQNGKTTDKVVDAISDDICGVPATCSCDPGYTLVYAGPDGNYTEGSGDCTTAICRKVTCECPDSPYDYTNTVESGTCDNVYDVGNPSYVNPDPRMCSYFYNLITPPSFDYSGIWRHNSRCDLYANYYGVDYPWEVEITENTGQNVTTLKSVEYQLESYVYKGDLYNGCADDRWHDLDFNFDESIIYNSEQISGLLKLELNPKEDPFAIIQYPIINSNDIQILYSKEEQKYRFNQFWDITDDRGEFSGVQRSQFITQLNGYIRDLNAFNLNYEKDSLQHKKFRHYYNKVLLRRKISGDRKMLLKLVNTKLNLSYR